MRAAPRLIRIGLFDLYLARGTLGRFLLLLPAAVIALLLERALRLIQELSASGADIGYLPVLLLQLVPYYTDTAIPLAFMAAMVLLVARLDERLELEAMLASGLSLTRIVLPLVAVGAGLALLALMAGGWLEPIGRYQYRALMIEAANSGKLGTLPPLALFQPSDDLAVTFDGHTPDGGMQDVFLWQRLPDGEERIISGAEGSVGFSRRAGMFAVHFAAGRYVAQPARRAGYTLDFRRLDVQLPAQLESSSWRRGWDAKELTVTELVRAETPAARGALAQAELYGRIVRALMIPLIPLLALPLAMATKKRGRALGLLLCAALVALFRHALAFAENLSRMGGVGPPALLLGTLAVFGAMILVLFFSARKLPSHSAIHSVLNPMAAGLVCLTPKSGAVPGLRGHTLTTYLAWELGKWTLVALALLTLFLQTVDLIERGDDFVSRSFGARDIGWYTVLKLPAILQQAVPLAALAGAMAGFGLLASRHEVTAMRAAGLSQWRVLSKAALVAVALLAATVGLGEWATPATQQRLALWWAQTAPAPPDGRAKARWFRIGDAIVRAEAASADGTRLSDVEIFSRDRAGRVDQRTSAERAAWRNGGWVLENVRPTRYGHGVEQTRTPRLVWNVSLRPDDVAAFFSNAPALSTAAAQRSLARVAPVSQGEAPFATRVQRSAAEPVASLIMLLFALPIAFVAPRTGRAWPALLYAGSAGMMYLIADGVLTVAAQVGHVPSALGAWAAPVMAALIGLTVLVYAER